MDIKYQKMCTFYLYVHFLQSYFPLAVCSSPLSFQSRHICQKQPEQQRPLLEQSNYSGFTAGQTKQRKHKNGKNLNPQTYLFGLLI